jgi:endonuclease/exonuclease/phosphatase family metal-dependent hydrolase
VSPAIRAAGLGLAIVLIVLNACESRPPASQPAAEPASRVGDLSWLKPTRPLGQPTGTFLDRAAGTVRVVTYNVKWNSIFPAVDPHRAAKFARIVRSLDPDVLALQEIGMHPQERGRPGSHKWTADEVLEIMAVIRPLPTDQPWHAWQGSDAVIVSRFPLKMTARKTTPPGERDLALALVDLPDDRFKVDLYVLNNHFKCCDATKNDPLRQQQADALVAWLRDARTPGGNVDLPLGTPCVVVGDLNIVGSFEPVQTLLWGDIHDEARYGPDSPPDWDDTPLTDAHPLHNVAGPEDWTWRDDTSKYQRGRLDFVIYSDSVLEAVNTFALDTSTMSAADLQAGGLEPFDVCHDELGQVYDHLPLVTDVRPR